MTQKNPRNNSHSSDVMHCDGCGAPITHGNGKFLRPILFLCDDCKTRTSWHPRKKALDDPYPVGVKVIRTK